MPLVQQVYFRAPYEAAVRDIELPSAGPGEVLVQSTLSAISHGTEMNVYRGTAPYWTLAHDQQRRLFLQGETSAWAYPLAYGYACMGRVTGLGEGVAQTLLGAQVFCYAPHQSCHVLRAEDLILVSELPDEKAVFVANVTTAFNGILDATMHYGDVVVIFGQGVIGQVVGRLCKASGCIVVVVDRHHDRLERAQAWGADVVINSREVHDVALTVRGLTGNRGADVVFDVTGNPGALHEAVRVAAPDCEVVALSWYGTSCADLVLGGEFHHNRIRIRSSQVGRVNPLLVNWSVARRMDVVLDILKRCDVESMITARFPLENAAEAYTLVDRGEPPPLQVVFTYT